MQNCRRLRVLRARRARKTRNRFQDENCWCAVLILNGCCNLSKITADRNGSTLRIFLIRLAYIALRHHVRTRGSGSFAPALRPDLVLLQRSQEGFKRSAEVKL
jgi:hypothetical protein